MTPTQNRRFQPRPGDRRVFELRTTVSVPEAKGDTTVWPPVPDVCGLRLVPSAFGYRELGGNPAKLKVAQHCRAKVFRREHDQRARHRLIQP